VVPEALTGAHAGRVLSREIGYETQAPRLFLESKAIPAVPRCEGQRGLARSHEETPSMRGSTLHENREALRPPVAMVLRAAVRSLRTQSTDGRRRESDCPVVAMKFPNKERRR
jgi:hypothetical protein